MIFSDQHVVVLSRYNQEIGMGEWSDELDNLARANLGYVVVINSDPAEILADYRPKTITMVTAGGYKVETVRTVDPSGNNPVLCYRVTHPNGIVVPLNPWNPRHSPKIRTIEQLIEVLEREGEDFTTLEEI